MSNSIFVFVESYEGEKAGLSSKDESKVVGRN